MNVGWQGNLIRVDYNNGFFARYPVQMLLNMRNSTSPVQDIVLRFEEHKYREYYDSILNAKRGDGVAFNATIMRPEDPFPQLDAYNFELHSEIHSDISPHFHSNGRYSSKTHFEDHEAPFKDMEGLKTVSQLDLENTPTEN